MNDKIFNVNINADEVVEYYESEQNEKNFKDKKVQYSPKNYLQARLGPGENEKTIIIRLLPFSAEETNPFKKVFIHSIKVNKEVSPSGWKRFICPTLNKKGDKCPFCDVSHKSNELKRAATSEVDKKKYGEIEFMYKAKAAFIVRCIERGHEDDGVKFWLFNENKQGKGVFDQLIKIQKRRQEKASLRGETCNIFDVNNGKDIILTLTKDTNGKTVVTVVDDDEKTPLTTNYELGVSWINDSKQWSDVYTVKPYEFMEIIINNGVPVYDKEKGKYVDMLEKKEETNSTTPEPEPEVYEETVQEGTNYSPVYEDDNKEYDDIPF